MYEPNTVIISNGFAAMGIWVPGAIAAKHVHPDRKVVALCVDGGFPMNSQELETAKRIGARDSFAEAIVNAVREAEAIAAWGAAGPVREGLAPIVTGGLVPPRRRPAYRFVAAKAVREADR